MNDRKNGFLSDWDVQLTAQTAEHFSKLLKRFNSPEIQMIPGRAVSGLLNLPTALTGAVARRHSGSEAAFI